MWKYLVRIILRYRIFNLIIICLLTAFMAYKALKVELSYELARMLPDSDSATVEYKDFKKMFGEDGNVFYVAIKNDSLFQLNNFRDWYDLNIAIKQIDGIEEIVSISRMLNLKKNVVTKKFEFQKVVSRKPETQTEVDSIKKVIFSLPFYKGLIYNKETNTFLMGLTLDKHKLNDKRRYELIEEVKFLVNQFAAKYKIEAHYSGLPYIRTIITEKVKAELKKFIIIFLIIAVLILVVFFRSFYVAIASMLVVVFSVIWTLGTISLLGYKITILTGVLPSLLILIAIENCIYLVNKYHLEYKSHGNKIKALSRVVRRIGYATFITNMTTAAGFATFIFTSNKILVEFGIVSTFNVMVEFILSFMLIPIIFSFIPPPKPRQLQHLDNTIIIKIIDKVINIALNKRKLIYTILSLFIIICLYGSIKIKSSGKIVDDISTDDIVYKDLKFFEENFNGVMPFEFKIDTKKKNGVLRLETIKKIDSLQKIINTFPEFSRPLSVAELVKFSKQAFYNGNDSMYVLPDKNEINFILPYYSSDLTKNKGVIRSFIDSNNRFTRVSVQAQDLKMKDINNLNNKIRPLVDSLFKPDKYKVVITGNSIVYAQGTKFLIDNLIISVIIGVVFISLIMSLVFPSPRMIFVAMFVNLLPLFITSAIMGFFKIPIKPSTLIVFSVALGISVDNAILFLSKYRSELKILDVKIKEAAINAIKETGISMIYTAVVFVLGFSIFMLSGFGGTKALGMLISISLFIALFFNLIVLPSFMVGVDRAIRYKKIRKPIIDIEEDTTTDEDDFIEK
ncbi:MAG: MMPL family transporter [Bacteroidales bacterium]|nr:MMPL family transporter [Bacteroidales bacterium]